MISRDHYAEALHAKVDKFLDMVEESEGELELESLDLAEFAIFGIVTWVDDEGDVREDVTGAFSTRKLYSQRGMCEALLGKMKEIGSYAS